MQTQAIILALVIITSLFITHNLPVSNQSNQGIIVSRVGSNASFLDDLSKALSRKEQLLVENSIILGSQWERTSYVAMSNIIGAGLFVSEKLSSDTSLVSRNIAQLHQTLVENIAQSSLGDIAIYKPDSIIGEISADAPPSDNSLSSGENCPLVDYNYFDAKVDFAKYIDKKTTLIKRNSDDRWPIASVTKLMTALVAREKLNPEDDAVISQRAATIGGSVVGNFKQGEVFKVKDLIQAMIVGSSNNAAMALADKFGEQEFIDAMQSEASNLGMSDTTYIEPTGLSFVNQSTATDLVKLMTYIYYNDPGILAISRQNQVQILELKSGKTRIVPNVDEFFGEANFIGGKTGFTDEAGHNLVALFKDGNNVLLTVVLGSKNSFEETRRIKNFVSLCQSYSYKVSHTKNGS